MRQQLQSCAAVLFFTPDTCVWLQSRLDSGKRAIFRCPLHLSFFPEAEIKTELSIESQEEPDVERRSPTANCCFTYWTGAATTPPKRNLSVASAFGATCLCSYCKYRWSERSFPVLPCLSPSSLTAPRFAQRSVRVAAAFADLRSDASDSTWAASV